MPESVNFQNGGQRFNIHLDSDGNLVFKANAENGDGNTRMLIHDDDGAVYLGPSGSELIRGDDPGTRSPSGAANNGLLIQSAQTVEVNINSNDAPADMFAVTKGSAREEIFRVEEDGDVKARNFIETSDLRQKKNIKPLKDVLQKVLSLQSVNFEWLGDEETQSSTKIGLIAQEVEQVIPEAVVTTREGYKGIVYSELVAMLIESIKEMYEKLSEQQETIKRMQGASGG